MTEKKTFVTKHDESLLSHEPKKVSHEQAKISWNKDNFLLSIYFPVFHTILILRNISYLVAYNANTCLTPKFSLQKSRSRTHHLDIFLCDLAGCKFKNLSSFYSELKL